MSSADDILFEPIGSNTHKVVDRQIVDAVKIALTGSSAIEFMIDPDVSIDIYDEIADLIENDSQVVNYTKQMVKLDSMGLVRPKTALSIKEVFHRLHAGDDEFYFCAQSNGVGIAKNKFTNWFAVDSQIPILHVDDISGGGGGYFEWWIVGVMSQFTGYQSYYSFRDIHDARKYYAVP